MGREYALFPSDGALPHMDFYSRSEERRVGKV